MMSRPVKTLLFAISFCLIFGFSSHAVAGCVGATQNFVCGDTITESCTMNEDLTTAEYSCFTIGANNIVVDGAGHSISGPYVMDGPIDGKAFRLEAHNTVTIQNFTISGFYYGISLYNGASCTVGENVVSGAYFGIRLEKGSGNTILGNSVSGAVTGLKLTGSTQNTIKLNEFYDNQYPIYLVYYSLPPNQKMGSDDNMLDGNWVGNNDYYGIYVSGSKRNTFINNVVTANGYDGMFIYESPGTVIQYNRIYNNTYYGIDIVDTSDCVVKYNQITGNPDSGIHFATDSPNNVLLGNKLCDNGNGTSSFDVYDLADNRGSSNACGTTSGYNDDNASRGCAFACGSGCVSATITYECGSNITESCTLNGDLLSYGRCFNVYADNITVDGGGFTVRGNGTDTAVAAIGTTGTTIRNFGIDNFATGISLSKRTVTPVKPSTQNRVLNNRVENTSAQAIYLSNSTANSIESNILKESANGINLQGTSTGNSLSSNTVARSTTNGITFAAAATGNTLAGNIFCASGARDVNNLGGITNTGTGTTCTTTGGTYNDSGKTGCTYTCGICSDGTFFGECSNNKPKYCMEGVLIDDCVRCGCDTNNCNASTGACEDIPPPNGKCVGATKQFACGDSVTESCTLNGHMASQGDCLTVTVNNVTIDGAGYSITGDKTGIGVGTQFHDNLTVRNLSLKNFFRGISLNNSKGSLVENCTITDNEGPGVWVKGHTQNSTVRNNTFHQNDGTAIRVDESTNNIIEGNTITGNTRGIYLRADSTGNTVRNNTVNDNLFNGIVVVESDGNTFSGNTLARNTVEGLSFYESNSNTIQSNNIRHHAEKAIFLRGSTGNTFSTNFVADNANDGIWFFQASSNNYLSGNIFCNNGGGTYYFDIDSEGGSNTGSNNMCGSVNNYDDSQAGTGCARECNTTGCDTGEKIYTCGETIMQSCTMYSHLTSQGTCFTVGANNITINGNGFSISGGNTHDTYGVYGIGRSNVTVRNLEVHDFYGGLRFENATGCVIDSNNFHNNKNGIQLAYSSNNQLTKNTVNSNEFSGIYLSHNSMNNLVKENTAERNAFGIRLLFNSDGNDLLNNEIRNNTENGIYLDFDTNLNDLIANIVCDNAIDICQDGNNTGDNNWCQTRYNWNDAGTTGCSFRCGPRVRSLPWLQLLLE